MDVAEKLVQPISEPLTWAEICELYPGQWVDLLVVDHEPNGSIRSARVIGHDRSMKQLLAQIGTPQPATVVLHTRGRLRRFPRIEMTDEIRDIIRPRR
jgi:hypothetical protein